MKSFVASVRKLNTVLCLAVAGMLISACSSSIRVQKTPLKKHLKTSQFSNQMTGLVVFDPVSKDTLVNHNGAQLFIPASNTKILSFYTALRILPKNMPLVKTHQIGKDTLIIVPMGDPTPLHPYFKDSTLLQLIAPFSHVGIKENRLLDHPYGPGWAWEDYDSYYAAERSALPLFGNVVELIQNDSVAQHNPPLFELKRSPTTPSFQRAQSQNIFYVSDKNQHIEIPFKTSDSLSLKILEMSSHKKLFSYSKPLPTNLSIIDGIPRDSVLKRMMKISDNFLAEQLLINASAYLTDTLSIKPAQNFMIKGPLKNLNQKPRWVDGSGLSRYNLISPISLVQVLEKIHEEIGLEKIKELFPVGGQDGTLKNWFPGNPNPYIFAKTGSLGNTYCLSGYLVTKKGKTLIFSYMNNHFTKSSSQVKQEMKQVLEAIRDQN